jgi:uncharacterized protein YndB with AHSA1/START domain
MQQKNQEINNTKNLEIVISRVFNAPRAAIYKAFSEAKALAQWWGPKGGKIQVAQLDFRPGGIFHYNMQSPMGVMWGRFNYLEMIEPERIVFTNSFSDENGNIIRAPFSATFPLEIMNILTLTEQDGKTTLILRGGPINATEAEQKAFRDMHAGMEQGFAGTFDQLDAYLISKAI